VGELKKDHRQDAKTPRKNSLLSFSLLGVLGALAVIPFAFSLKGPS
jgi:hypothetical protein